jgi:hypothetical protein
MRGVSKAVVKFAGIAVILITLLAQPAMAASTSRDCSTFGTLLRRLVARVLDTTQISFPPG